MLRNNTVCLQANNTLSTLERQRFGEFIKGQNDIPLVLYNEVLMNCSDIVYAYASEAYKCLMSIGECSSDLWVSRYSELTLYGMLLSGVVFIYDTKQEKLNRYTCSQSLLRQMINQGILISRKDNIQRDMELFDRGIRGKGRIKDNLQRGGCFQAVRLDYKAYGNVGKFTGTFIRSPYDFTNSIIIPAPVMEMGIACLSTLIDEHLVKITMGDKVRYVTRNKSILLKVYDEKRVRYLLSQGVNQLLGVFYVPSVGASVVTSGLTLIDLLAIDKVEKGNLSEVDLSDVNVDITGAESYFKKFIMNADLEVVNTLCKRLNMIDDNNLGGMLRYKLIGLNLEPLKFYKIMKDNPDIFDIEDFKHMDSKFGKLGKPIALPQDLREKYEIIKRFIYNNVVKIGYTNSRGGISTLVVTNNNFKLRDIYGSNFEGYYESYNVRLKNLLLILKDNDLEGVDPMVLGEHLNIDIDWSIPRKELIEIIEEILEENSKPSKITGSYAKNPTEAGLVILARNCFATPNVNNQEGSRDYYKNIDITKVVSLIPYY